MTTPIITTPEQVAVYFDADFDCESVMAENSARLSRRIYKKTACGAWADFMRRDITHHEQQEWIANYARFEGVWQLLALAQVGVAAEFSVHSGQIREYFWPSAESMQEFLDTRAGGATNLTLSETVEVKVKTGEEWIFRVGSIVEGIDAEVMPEEVSLPCTPDDLTRAVEVVEAEAQRLWDETHGCENCGEENETGYRRVDSECSSCGGTGVTI